MCKARCHLGFIFCAFSPFCSSEARRSTLSFQSDPLDGNLGSDRAEITPIVSQFPCKQLSPSNHHLTHVWAVT